MSFELGEGCDVGVVDGVEMACKKFKTGEKSVLKVTSNYAYGYEGNKEFNIPPGAEVTYEVEMKKFEKVKICSDENNLANMSD